MKSNPAQMKSSRIFLLTQAAVAVFSCTEPSARAQTNPVNVATIPKPQAAMFYRLVLQ